ncbi:MAG: hypothetical protein HY609_05915 [Deltaproteobacteria bacterium]|nr:hypothetical protein [Deltaproteobacteria bacterium]
MLWFLVPIVIGLAGGGCLPTRKVGDPPDGGNKDEKDAGNRLDGDGPPVSQDMFVSDADGNSPDPDMFPPDAGVPGPPVLLHPAQDATLQPTLPPNPLGAFLAWEDGFLPAGAEVSHYVLCHTTEGADVIDGPACPNSQEVVSRYALIDTITAATDYYWKVQSCFKETGGDCTPFSEIRTFHGGDESMLPLAKWDFNGNLNDSGPNGLHGESPVNAGFASPAFVANGDICSGEAVSGLLEGERAACFDDSDGTYDYVQLTQHIDRLGFGSVDDYSVEIRARRDAAAGGSVNLFRMAGDYTPRPSDPVLTVSLTSEDEAPEYANRVFVERSGIQLYSVEELPLGAFAHTAVVHNGEVGESTLQLFTDGVLQDGDSSDYPFAAADFNYTTVHAVPGCPETCLLSANVLLDHIAVYPRALSPEEVVNNLCAFGVLTGTVDGLASCLNSAE